MLPHSPASLWKSSSALAHAREQSLAWARNEVRRRRQAAAAADRQVYQDSHLGYFHLEFFRREFPQIIATLPPHFTALEAGAGMGWHAALLAAHGASRVLATEVAWSGENPYALPNIHALYRLAERDAQLKALLHFDRDPDGHLQRVAIGQGRVQFARAVAEALPAPDESFDLVYTVNCLEHLPRLGESFAEAARVLRPGGVLFASTEPLYFSAFGHHLDDIFPLPWGHLLWEPAELADLVVRESGAGREWAPGQPLTASILLEKVFPSLNGATPGDIKAPLLAGPWELDGWVDIAHDSHEALALKVGIREALKCVPTDALLLAGLKLRLRKNEARRGLRLPLRLSHLLRRRLRFLTAR